MYTREFSQPPENIVHNGKAEFGSYNDVSPKIDIRGMRAPYAGIPLPSFLSNLRIKSRLTYIFSLENFIGLASFIDFKAVGLGEICMFNKKTGKKYVYHTIMSPRRRFIPVTTTRGICACYRKSRFIKISWGRKHQHHALSFKLKGDNARPNVEGYVYSPMQDNMHCDLEFVTPSPSSSRCFATWLSTMHIKGQISINKELSDDSTGLALMNLSRAYYKMHSNYNIATGIGSCKGKEIIFNISTTNMDAADSDTYNNNALIIDGEETLLPPVYMTHPFGISNQWIIQDTENMVDLTFTPSSVNSRVLNLIVLRTSYKTMYGTFEGVLLTKDGTKVSLKGFPGIIQKGMLRL